MDLFFCYQNSLNSLKYSPNYVGGVYSFTSNKIYSFDGIDKIESSIFYGHNPIEELINLFDENANLYLEYLEVYNFQKKNTNIVYKTRFIEALNNIGITELPILKNYIYQ